MAAGSGRNGGRQRNQTNFDLQGYANANFVSYNNIFTILFFNIFYHKQINRILIAAFIETFRQSLDPAVFTPIRNVSLGELRTFNPKLKGLRRRRSQKTVGTRPAAPPRFHGICLVEQLLHIPQQIAHQIDFKPCGHIYYGPAQDWISVGQTQLNPCCFMTSWMIVQITHIFGVRHGHEPTPTVGQCPFLWYISLIQVHMPAGYKSLA